MLRFVMMVLSSAPPFLLALLGILLFSYYLNLLPAIGRTGLSNAPTGPTGLLTIDGLLAGRLDVAADAFQHLLLPAFCVAIGPAVSIGRVFRTGLIHNLDSDHVRTARAKGLRESAVIWRHAVRNAIGSSLAMTGLQTGLMFSGVVIIETVFSWPGIGLYTDQSIARLGLPCHRRRHPDPRGRLRDHQRSRRRRAGACRPTGRVVTESAELRARAAARVAEMATQLLELSHSLHAEPELAFSEHHSAAKLAALMEAAGFEVERSACDLPTALVATYGTGDLTVGICAEYDALPGIGHACGHNIIGASGARRRDGAPPPWPTTPVSA